MFNKNFYPTPKDIISKMWGKLKKEYVKTVLEPSAGKGDILDYIKNFKAGEYSNQPLKLYCVELEPELKNILFGKGYTVLANDFLTFESYTKFDTILMNPPFDNGDKHLLKALELIENGGQIVCLLNADTIKNPFSNDRKRLVAELKELNAEIDYLENAFSTAERKTNVNIVMIYIYIPFNPLNSDIFKKCKFEAKQKTEEVKKEITDIVVFDELTQMIEDYNTEVKLYIEAHKATQAFNSFTRMDFILGKQFDKNMRNYDDIILLIRNKYWRKALNSSIFQKYLTSNAMEQFLKAIEKQSEIEFNLKNIFEVKAVLIEYFIENLEKAAIEMFDKLTKNHFNECSTNIHYYSGWKTNKGSRINKKIILPSYYKKNEIAAELEKVLNYFDAFKEYEPIKLPYMLRNSDGVGFYAGDYFDCQVFQKGTMHIWFKRMDLLDKLNIFAGKKKNWLPDDEELVKKYQKDVVQHYKADENVDTGFNTSGILMLEEAL